MLEFLKDKRVGVLAGGNSSEREVSLRSGRNVYDALIRLGYTVSFYDIKETPLNSISIDLAFVALHGHGGEDGHVQACLEELGIPYTGSRVLASAVAMNKVMTKQIINLIKLPTAAYWLPGELPESPVFPLIIKPISDGSSVGISLIETPEALDHIKRTLGTQLANYFFEAYIPGKEVTVSIVESETGFIRLPILELRPKNKFYDYQAKYTAGMTTFILPAEISKGLEKKLTTMSQRLHHQLGCQGVSRVDWIIGEDKEPVILEINTIPGLTNTSDLPAQAAAAGISFDRLVELILKTAT